MKKIIIIVIGIFSFVYGQPKITGINTMPGSFSRMGFGARGIGMGNAMTAINKGNLNSYYNPALTVFQEKNAFQTSYSVLSLDRSLNYLNFTRRFDFYSSTSQSDKPSSTAGFSFGIINSGVSDIDGRDNSGIATEKLSTSENVFFIGLANKFSDKFSLGINVKYFYYKLYNEISSSSVGIDIGALYKINANMNLSLVLTDLNSKYKWDTAPVYERDGISTENKFPLMKKLGFSYTSDDRKIIAAVEFEASNAGSSIIRGGIEYNIYEQLFLRAGLDQINLKNKDYPVMPSAGFSYYTTIGGITTGIDYAFAIEQYSPTDKHIIGINLVF